MEQADLKTVSIPPPGTRFGRLTAIGESLTPNGRTAVLCLCECGEHKVVQIAKLLSGHTKSCGCLLREPIDLTSLKPGEVPLYGKKAAGRVARIDGGDYDLVMQYRWFVTQGVATATRRPWGPYASTNTWINGQPGTLRMHVLIMGRPYIDHIDHDGLNNQRSNLRPATGTENAGNQRPRLSVTSSYKGVSRHSPTGKWQAGIQASGRKYHLGYFSSEIEAARTYDTAARELFGEFACTNFQDESTQATRDAWAAAVTKAERTAHHPGLAGWWGEREPAVSARQETTRTGGAAVPRRPLV